MVVSSTRPVRTHRYFVLLVLILLLGLLLRVWFWHDQALASSVGQGDEDEYYRGAIHILLQGDYYDTGKWLRPPLTSLYLAGAFRVLGVNLPAALLFESALSLLAVCLTAVLARRLFKAAFRAAPEGAESVSILAAACVAFFLPFAAYASRLLSENIFIILLALALVLLERAQARIRRAGSQVAPRWHARPALLLLLAGLAIGLSILTRAFLFYYTPLLLFWLWHERRRLTPALRDWSWIALGVFICIAPWSIRNYTVYHQFVLVDTESGYSMLNGAAPDQNETALQEYWLKAYPNSAQRQQAQFAAAFEKIRQAPLEWVGRMRDKVSGLWHLHVRNLANNGARGASIQTISVTYALISDAEYVLLMLAALLSLAFAQRDRLFWPMLGLPIYTMLVGAVTVTSVRIREPLMLAVIPYAALALSNWRTSLQQLRQAGLINQAALAAGVAVFLGLIYSNSYGGFLLGRVWLAAARFGGGEGAIQQAIRSDPDNISPYLALGDYDLAHGRQDAARVAYGRAHDLTPDNPSVQARLIQVGRLSGDVAGATTAAKPVQDVGWDNSQWYEWAWSRMPFAVPARVDLAAPAVGVMRRVQPAENEHGVEFRWTIDLGEFRITGSGERSLALRLRANEVKRVQILLNGVDVQSLTVTPAWTDYHVPLEQPATGAVVVTLVAPTTVDAVADPYPHGVAVAGLRLEE